MMLSRFFSTWTSRLYSGTAFVCVSLFICGPLRSIFAIPMWTTLPISIITVLGSVLAVRRLVIRKHSPQNNFHLSFLLPVLAIVLYLLYYPMFGGLVSVGGGDAGNHVHFAKIFAESDRNIYQSFGSFFGVTYWLGMLGLNNYQAFEGAFFIAVIFIFGLAFKAETILLKEFPQNKGLERPQGNDQMIGLMAFVLIGLLPARRILLPLLHYLQADGFYPQLYGLIPLLGFWISLCLVESLVALVINTGLAILLYRFSYGLNLGDLFLTCGLLFFVWTTSQAKGRVIGIFLGLCAFVIGGICYYHLLYVSGIYGAIVKPNLLDLLSGISLLALASFLLNHNLRPLLRSHFILFMSFPSFFGIVGTGAIALHLRFIGEASYYVYKYGFHAAILLTVYTIAALAALAACVLNRRPVHCLLSLILGLLLAFFGLWQTSRAFSSYQVTFQERAFNKSQPQNLQPLIDRGAWEIIEMTLKGRGMKFHGYITPSWPISNFMNSAFGFYGEKPFYTHAKVTLEPGTCIFFHTSSNDLERYRTVSPHLERRVLDLLKSPKTQTINYKSQEGQGEAKLSILCKP